jgi:hypothetical protein
MNCFFVPRRIARARHLDSLDALADDRAEIALMV